MGARRLVQSEYDDIGRRLRAAVLVLAGVSALGTTGYWSLGQLPGNHPPWSLLDCAYMTAITLTTVGYGEVIDVGSAPFGREFTMMILALGLGTTVYVTSALTTFLVEGQLEHIRSRRKMKKLLEGLTDHVIVCGIGAAGARAVEEFKTTRTPVCAIDGDADRLGHLQRLHPEVPVIEGDATTDDVLSEAGIDRARGIVCCLHDDKDNLFLAVSARQLNPRLRIVTRGENLASVEKLRRAGADAVVTPATIGGLRLASEMIRPETVQFLDLMMRDKKTPMRIEDVPVPASSPAAGKHLGDVLPSEPGALAILAIRSPGGDGYEWAPAPTTPLPAGGTVVVMASPEAAARVRARLGG